MLGGDAILKGPQEILYLLFKAFLPGQPGGIFCSENHVQKSFGGQNVDRQSDVPERDAEAQLALAFEVDLILVDGHFQNAFERRLRDKLGIQKAQAVLFDGESVDVAALEIHDNGQFLRAADGDAKFGIFEFSQRFGEWINTHTEAALLESVAQFVKVEDAAVHGATAPLWGIQARPEPFEIRGIPSVDGDMQAASRS